MINEALMPMDLERLVSNVFEIDAYKSKMGSDKDIVVLSFTVDYKEPATDLVNFIERGYSFVLDADSTPGELKDGKYKVFVELERNRRAPEHIIEILEGIKRLTGIETFRFRYYKSFKSITATVDTIRNTVPVSKQDYEVQIQSESLNNFSNFFSRSYLDSVNLSEDDLVFQRSYADPIRLRILNAGPVNEMYSATPGKILLESAAISECMFLTKYIGDYNITKVGNAFIFENGTYAVVLERL